MVDLVPPRTDADVLATVLCAGEPNLKPETAEWLLNLHFTDAQKARMLDLADRGNRGTLTADEKEEMHRYRRVGNMLSILAAKARLALRGPARSV